MKKEIFLFKTKINLIRPFINEIKFLKIDKYKVLNETNHDVRIEMETSEALKILHKSMLIENAKVLIISGKKIE